MYLHSRHVHPSVLKVMESQGKAVRPVHKTAKGGKIVLESVQSDGRRITAQITEENYFDDLFIEISPTRAFVLNESDQYELRRIDEGVMDMVRGAWNWAKGLFSKWAAKLRAFFGPAGKPGIEKEFMKLYEKDPKKAEEMFKQAATQAGKTPEEIDKAWGEANKSAQAMYAAKKGIKEQDPAYLQPMAMANDAAKRGDKQAAQQAAQQAIQHIHANTVNMQGGGAQGEKGAKGDQGKPGQAPEQQPAQQPAQAPAQGQQPVQQPPEKQPAQAPPADDQSKQPSLKAGDTVEKADAQGNKVQGEVVTVDEEQAKQWNSQFAGAAGFKAIKAGLVVKTPKGFVPLDADWKAYQAQPAQAAQQPAQAQTPPAPAATTPPAAEPAKQPETAPAEPPQAAQPPAQQSAAQPAQAPDAGLTQAEVGPAATPAPPTRKAPSTAAANAANAQRRKFQRGFYDKQGKLAESKVRKGNLLEVFEQSDRPRRRLGKGTK